MSEWLEKQKHEKRLEKHLTDMPFYVHEYIQAQKRVDRSPSTLLGYVYEYEKFFTWLMSEGIVSVTQTKDIPLSALESMKKSELDCYVDFLKEENILVTENLTKKRSVSAVNRNLSALRSLFQYLTTETENEDGECYFYRNVMSKIKITKDKKSANSRANNISAVILHNEEITDFLTFVKEEYEQTVSDKTLKMFQKNRERDIAILSLFLGAGIRVSELASLTLQSIDFRKGKASFIRKGNKKDTIDILPEALHDLKDYLAVRNVRYRATDKDPFLFVTNYQNQIKPLSIRAIQNLVDKYTKAFNQGGKGLSPHKLRHSFAGDYLKNGGSIVLLRDQLGHNSIETTALYTNMDDKERKKVIEKMSKNRRELSNQSE